MPTKCVCDTCCSNYYVRHSCTNGTPRFTYTNSVKLVDKIDHSTTHWTITETQNRRLVFWTHTVMILHSLEWFLAFNRAAADRRISAKLQLLTFSASGFTILQISFISQFGQRPHTNTKINGNQIGGKCWFNTFSY